jgi:putative ABC transport system permease protein
MLGIIFGVASVITMLSIGEGAKREAIAKYQDLGVNNIIIREKNLSDQELEEVRAKFSPGLSLQDASVIKEIVPGVTNTASQSELSTDVKYTDKSAKSTVIGITPEFVNIMNYKTGKGEFIGEKHYNSALRVCVLGAGVARTLFGSENPIGKMVKISDQWFEVSGVLQSKTLFTETVGELAARDLNNDIYVPLSTFLNRFTHENVLASQIQQITVQVESSERLVEASKLINGILQRHHFNNEDYNMSFLSNCFVRRKGTTDYNFLLGAIAAISLVVGGIGIMNIMLATVMERTREIGIRRAIGARKSDIMSQFVTEAVAISITGGLIGVILASASRSRYRSLPISKQ